MAICMKLWLGSVHSRKSKFLEEGRLLIFHGLPSLSHIVVRGEVFEISVYAYMVHVCVRRRLGK